MKNLVIIESPGKASTIKSALGKGYSVEASLGHVRDLPKSKLGVDVEHGFEPTYIAIRGKSDLMASLKKKVENADKVYLATDPDREGEAISWHLSQVLNIPDEKLERVTFNEITKKAIVQSMGKSRKIDMDLVNSQQARRIVDRIVGYEMSPYLWKTVKRGLSAGRVQSVAARIVYDRDEEIANFIPEEYWTISADVIADSKHTIQTKYYGENGKEVKITCEEQADKILDKVKGSKFKLTGYTIEEKAKAPNPPYITSTLQQDASRIMGFASKKTMKLASELYEGISLGAKGHTGLITYMRTDSLRISDEASESAKKYIIGTFGVEYYPDKKRFYKTKDTAQDAHEAIRPTDVFITPDSIKSYLSRDQYKLYGLIWRRFVSSQMKNAILQTANETFDANGSEFKASETKVVFNGFMTVSKDESEKSSNFTKLVPGAEYDCSSIDPKQNFTSPPPHYTEGSLIKYLDDKGIGRPSTYATILSTIIEREYVKVENKSFCITPLGKAIVEIMKKSFPDYVDIKFTSEMESDLDDIAQGKTDMLTVLTSFYKEFSSELEKANMEINNNKVHIEPEKAGFTCELCGADMVIRKSKYGTFAACSNYPKCKNTKSLETEEKKKKVQKTAPEETDRICPDCGGQLVIRTSKNGKFYACKNFPACKFTESYTEKTDAKCPECGSEMVKLIGMKNRPYYRCSNYPDCKYTVNKLTKE